MKKNTGPAGGRGGRFAVAAVPLVVAAALLPILAGPPAGASPGLASSHTTCPTEPYSHGHVGNCRPTTSTSRPSHGRHSTSANGSNRYIIASYSNGTLDWQACGFPSAAAGTTVQLYVNGSVQAGGGGAGQVQANGCTPDPNDSICLASGAYTLAAVDEPYGEATADLQVAPSKACGSARSHGSLAFTGSDIARLVVVGLVVIAIGYAIVRLNRQRRRARV